MGKLSEGCLSVLAACNYSGYYALQNQCANKVNKLKVLYYKNFKVKKYFIFYRYKYIQSLISMMNEIPSHYFLETSVGYYYVNIKINQ